MNLTVLLDQIKNHPNYADVGMVLAHNGVVRSFSRDGRKVSGFSIQVDQKRLDEIVAAQKKRPGIVEILVEIVPDGSLTVGDDVMYLVVAGDLRENVIAVLTDTLNEIKTSVTAKTEFFVDTQDLFKGRWTLKNCLQHRYQVETYRQNHKMAHLPSGSGFEPNGRLD